MKTKVAPRTNQSPAWAILAILAALGVATFMPCAAGAAAVGPTIAGDGAPRYPSINEEGGMLIIVYDPWLANVEPLAVHKRSIGIPTTVVGVATIGNNSTAIKAYIQSAYEAGDLAFVLLVGDAPHVAAPHAWGAVADPLYAKLAGDDDYPDVLVGRFSAETAAQVDTQVQRTITYEASGAPLQDWFWRGTGIASSTAVPHMDNIRDTLLAHGYTLVDQIYDPGATPTMVMDALNAGRGIVNYVGHGTATSWSTSGFSNAHVNALANDNMLPFIFSVAPLNGQFEGGTCFGEAWLRATHDGAPTGAIATYMFSTTPYWDGPLSAQEEFVTLLVNGTYRTFGALCFAAASQMIAEYGQSGVQMFDTWIVFGDPSLCVVGPVYRRGDLNCDGSVGFGDINPFVLALSNPIVYGQTYPGCSILNGDINGDGTFDFGDINPFVALLVG